MSAIPDKPAGPSSPLGGDLCHDPSTDGDANGISLLLVDEQRMFTDALSRDLASDPDMRPIGAVDTVAAAVAACLLTPPDVALLDLRVRDMNGVQGISAIRDASPGTSVIIVTDVDDAGVVSSAIRAGAKGYVLKTRAVEELIMVIRQSAKGGIALGLADVPKLIGGLQRVRERESEARRVFALLTAREHQILVLLAHGRSTTETAAALHISPLTVRSHVKGILTKLGVHSKLEAVSYALRNGLVLADRSA